jgi:multiple sugar transport system ATP-binding protein
MAEIVLDRVTKRYPNGATAVKDLSITIADGEFIILVGPSGCGKSTTLNMIAGLEEITSGELRIGGERVNEKAPKDRDIAMVFQSYALYPHMTVRQNIAFPLTLAKMKKAEIAQKVEETAKILDLTDFLDRKPAQLSGGQRQRVAMGRAIVRNPKAFLMDEPLSNLDAKLRVQMRSEISRLQHRLGTTTVYVTHDQIEAMTLGDRVVVLLGGIAQQIGTPEELYSGPVNLFVAGFIGSPAMNFFPATLTDVGVRLPFGDITLTQQVHDVLAQHHTPNNVIVGIRPEHLEDATLIDTYARIRALTFEVKVDFVESLGADKYVHFKTEGAGAHAEQLAELAADSGAGENEFVARVSTESRATPGQTMELAFDTTKIAIFDGDTGANLTIPPTSGPREEPTTPVGAREEPTTPVGAREEAPAPSAEQAPPPAAPEPTPPPGESPPPAESPQPPAESPPPAE